MDSLINPPLWGKCIKIDLAKVRSTYCSSTYISPSIFTPLITNTPTMDDTKGLAIAFEEAQASYDEGGIPVCSNPRLNLPRGET